MNVLSEIVRIRNLIQFRLEASRQPLLANADRAAIAAARLAATRPALAAHAWRLATERRLLTAPKLPDRSLSDPLRRMARLRTAQVRILEAAAR